MDSAGHVMEVESSNSVNPVCWICLAIVSGNYTDGRSGHKLKLDNEVGQEDLYLRFINFCVQYLKVDPSSVDGIAALKQEEGLEVPSKSFCSGCEQVIRTTLKLFEEWNEVKIKLLGSVNELGLIISKSSPDGSPMRSAGVLTFREQVENKCYTKTHIIQPTIRLTPIEGAKREHTLRLSSRNNFELKVGPSTPKTDFSSTADVESGQSLLAQSDDGDDDKSFNDSRDPTWSPQQALDKPAPERKCSVDTTRTRKAVKRKDCSSIRQQSLRSAVSIGVSGVTESRKLCDPEDAESKTGTQRGKRIEDKRSRPNYNYKCSECGKRMRRRTTFFKHTLTVHEGVDLDEFLECSVCQEKQTDILELQTHLKSEHESPEIKNIFCVHCSEAFTTQQLRDLHRRLDHTKCPHILCEVDGCNEKFIPVSDYCNHLRSHCSSNDLIHRCEQCGRGFLGVHHYELHKLHHIPKDDQGFHTCPMQQCLKHNKYRNIDKLINHYNNHHLTKKDRLLLHRCNLCKKSPCFIFRKELLIHMKSHAIQVQCQVCSQVFVGRNALKVHQFNKHPNECKSTLISSQRQIGQELEEQPEPHHSGDNFELAIFRTCPYCSKKFLNFQDLEKHKARKHKSGVANLPVRVQCEICGLTVSKSQLPRHLLRHKEPHLPCPYPPCKRKFRREDNLLMHVKKLHDQKKSDWEFFCDTCGRQYLSRGLLNRHVKEHHQKTFACHLCSKKFSTVGRVNEHLWAAHTNEKFQCRWCPSQYGWLTKLKVHARKKHPEHAHLLKTIYNYAMKPEISQYKDNQPTTEERVETDDEAVVGRPATGM